VRQTFPITPLDFSLHEDVTEKKKPLPVTRETSARDSGQAVIGEKGRKKVGAEIHRFSAQEKEKEGEKERRRDRNAGNKFNPSNKYSHHEDLDGGGMGKKRGIDRFL